MFGSRLVAYGSHYDMHIPLIGRRQHKRSQIERMDDGGTRLVSYYGGVALRWPPMGVTGCDGGRQLTGGSSLDSFLLVVLGGASEAICP
ncbi:unnamed protein product [Linum trigynum]|uniref:Uncharacterized protein n=1 Tax=Linum trigynum TaxID=586398 RepID=A0AAV2G6W7_9ROSI